LQDFNHLDSPKFIHTRQGLRELLWPHSAIIPKTERLLNEMLIAEKDSVQSVTDLVDMNKLVNQADTALSEFSEFEYINENIFLLTAISRARVADVRTLAVIDPIRAGKPLNILASSSEQLTERIDSVLESLDKLLQLSNRTINENLILFHHALNLSVLLYDGEKLLLDRAQSRDALETIKKAMTKGRKGLQDVPPLQGFGFFPPLPNEDFFSCEGLTSKAEIIQIGRRIRKWKIYKPLLEKSDRLILDNAHAAWKRIAQSLD
jgi:hypothetical protein